MADSHEIKNRVIFTLLVVILIMVTAIVVLAYNNDYILKPADASSDGKWKVEFSSITEGEKTGSATNRFIPYYVGTSAYFHVDFIAPGDSIVYDVQVSNLGNLDAELEDIVYGESLYEDAIKYEVIDIEKGDILAAGSSKNFKIKVSYVLHSNVAVEFDDPILIKFNYVQYQ